MITLLWILYRRLQPASLLRNGGVLEVYLYIWLRVYTYWIIIFVLVFFSYVIVYTRNSYIYNHLYTFAAATILAIEFCR